MAKTEEIAEEQLNEATIAFEKAFSTMAEERSYAYALGFLISQLLGVMEEELSAADRIRILEKIAKNATKKGGF